MIRKENRKVILFGARERKIIWGQTTSRRSRSEIWDGKFLRNENESKRERDSILEIWGVSTSLQDRDGEQEQRGCNTKENFVVTKGERESERQEQHFN